MHTGTGTRPNHSGTNPQSLDGPLPIRLPVIRDRGPDALRNVRLPPALRAGLELLAHGIGTLRGEEPGAGAEVIVFIREQEVEQSGRVAGHGGHFGREIGQRRGVFGVEGG